MREPTRRRGIADRFIEAKMSEEGQQNKKMGLLDQSLFGDNCVPIGQEPIEIFMNS
jgi:hypothetical protein